MKPELISFDLCPFVQRSVITLLEKNVDHKVTFIDLANPPAWFLKISPFGKVPALRMGETTLFESAVINEYLDEITPPSMHPKDPLQKAVNRAWIEFASELIGSWYLLSIAKTEETFEIQEADLHKKLSQLEAQLKSSPFFNGDAFCLIDAAFAPALIRLDFTERHANLGLFEGLPKIQTWLQNLMARESVTNSILDQFDTRSLDYIKSTNGYSALRHSGHESAE